MRKGRSRALYKFTPHTPQKRLCHMDLVQKGVGFQIPRGRDSGGEAPDGTQGSDQSKYRSPPSKNNIFELLGARGGSGWPFPYRESHFFTKEIVQNTRKYTKNSHFGVFWRILAYFRVFWTVFFVKKCDSRFGNGHPESTRASRSLKMSFLDRGDRYLLWSHPLSTITCLAIQHPHFAISVCYFLQYAIWIQGYSGDVGDTPHRGGVRGVHLTGGG